jgi:hypothetical protein
MLMRLAPPIIETTRRKTRLADQDHESQRYLGVDATSRHHPFPDLRGAGIALRVPASRPRDGRHQLGAGDVAKLAQIKLKDLCAFATVRQNCDRPESGRKTG